MSRDEPSRGSGGPGTSRRSAEGAMAESSGYGSVSVDVERISFGGKVRPANCTFRASFQLEIFFSPLIRM
jgi:hypothetical protein